MGIMETAKLSLSNIWASKVRSLLTMLGIIIGVCAVIVIVGLGNGMQGYIGDSFSSLGTDSLTVMITGRGSSRSISEEQMYSIVSENPGLLHCISPTISVNSSAKIGNETLSGTTINGVSEEYLDIKHYTLSSGRGILYSDILSRQKVCVVGQYLNMAYYSGRALGQTLKLGGTTFTIVGVMSQEDDDLESGGTDDCIFLPYSTAARMTQNGTISSYIITVSDESRLSEAQALLEDKLYAIFQDENAYRIINMSSILDTMNSMVNMIVLVLSAIAAISLVVGGIGIMNIMLVSVTERTREIGIRKALGAREGSILRQFVLEAAITSALGGILGILLGYALSSVASVIISSAADAAITVAPTIFSVLLAFGVSAGIGVIFGFLPAQKAARLNPIDALRYD